MSSDDPTDPSRDDDRPYQSTSPAEFRERFAAMADQLRRHSPCPRPQPGMADHLQLLKLYDAGFLTFAQYVARRAQLVDGDDSWAGD